jgi:hypothetical protein
VLVVKPTTPFFYVMPREFHLCHKPEGGCALKVDENTVRHFEDVLEAISYIHALPGIEGATLTVYDVLGNATLHGPV